MMGDLVPIYTAADLVQAQMLRDHLADQEIEAWIINQALAGGVGELPAGWSSSPRLVVASSNAERARALAVAFDQALVAGRHTPQKEVVEPAPQVELDAWPRCLMCGERRMTICRFCGTSGVNFPQAFRAAGAEQEFIILCPTCDEPFVARFYKECEHCGYEFEDGIPIPRPVADPEALREDLTRMWIVLGGLVLFLAGCGAYLAWLMRD